MKFRFVLLAMVVALPAQARDFSSNISDSADIIRLRPEFKVPDEPNQLFYVQRSPNSNTVVYAAKLDAQGNVDSRTPVEAFWRKFNIDGSRQPLNFVVGPDTPAENPVVSGEPAGVAVHGPEEDGTLQRPGFQRGRAELRAPPQLLPLELVGRGPDEINPALAALFVQDRGAVLGPAHAGRGQEEDKSGAESCHGGLPLQPLG
jgi:hypothetical protein